MIAPTPQSVFLHLRFHTCLTALQRDPGQSPDLLPVQLLLLCHQFLPPRTTPPPTHTPNASAKACPGEGGTEVALRAGLVMEQVSMGVKHKPVEPAEAMQSHRGSLKAQ